ncbi:hypothetical protein ACKWUH_000003 [Campylobacter jejuni]|nr:hypothetical protein [Campylobacter jejuni]
MWRKRCYYRSKQRRDSVTLTLYSNNYGAKETGRFRAGMSQSLNNIAR